MRFGKSLFILAVLSLATSRASAATPDDTTYPDVPAEFEGAQVIDHDDFVSEGVVYPGPHIGYVKCLPPKNTGVLALSDDTVYPTADTVRAPEHERARSEETLTACTCADERHGD